MVGMAAIVEQPLDESEPVAEALTVALGRAVHQDPRLLGRGPIERLQVVRARVNPTQPPTHSCNRLPHMRAADHNTSKNGPVRGGVYLTRQRKAQSGACGPDRHHYEQRRIEQENGEPQRLLQRVDRRRFHEGGHL